MKGVLIGVGLAILAFALAWLRDAWRSRQENLARQRAALSGFQVEIVSNYDSAESMLNTLGFEMRQMDAGTSGPLLNPLTQLETGAWPIARVNLPTKLLEDDALMKRLRALDRKTQEANTIIQSREMFRIQHLRDDELIQGGIHQYGKLLSFTLRDIKQRTVEAAAELEPHTRRPTIKTRVDELNAPRVPT